jgi:Pyruvate/2-oxoacid:ferredoxin oxidoreductase delta subunit
MSTDPVALDATVCRLVNVDEKLVDTIVFGEEFGLGTATVEILGDPIEAFISPDFKVNREPSESTTSRNSFFTTVIRRFVSQRPVIDAEKCTRCGKCEEICPAQPKALTWENGRKQPPVYDYSLCIRCFCCQEICPHEAISVKTPVLRRLIHR